MYDKYFCQLQISARQVSYVNCKRINMQIYKMSDLCSVMKICLVNLQVKYSNLSN